MSGVPQAPQGVRQLDEDASPDDLREVDDQWGVESHCLGASFNSWGRSRRPKVGRDAEPLQPVEGRAEPTRPDLPPSHDLHSLFRVEVAHLQHHQQVEAVGDVLGRDSPKREQAKTRLSFMITIVVCI